jgi:adenylate kinase
MIVSISGTPGTGKTAVGRALAKRLGWRLLELNKLAEEKQLYCGYDRERDIPIVDIGKIWKAIQERLKKDKNLIFESHYAHDFPADLRVVLRCGISELRKRLEKKGWGKKKIEENVQAEIFGICAEEARERGPAVEIDTAGKKPSETAEEIACMV